MKSQIFKYKLFINDVVKFLLKYNWIYNFKWVEIGKVNPWSDAPQTWKYFLENLNLKDLQKLVKGDFSFDTIPSDLIDFFVFQQKCFEFILNINNFPNYENNDKNVNFKGINPKKIHEILNITKFVKEFIIKDEETCNIVDIGSGLGYLARIISSSEADECKEVLVLAIEGNDDFHGRNLCNNRVKKLNFIVTKDNLKDLNNEIEKIFPRVDLITGLHSCGALSCHILNLYSHLSTAKSLLLFSCCYHRMFGKDSREFPLSDFYHQLNSENTLSFTNPVFLRLGCQERQETWLQWKLDDFHHHQYSVGLRAVIESYLSTKDPISDDFNDDDIINKLKRIKIKKENLSNITFIDFINDKLTELILINKQRFIGCVNEEEKKLKWYSIMLALQMAIQNVVEVFILMDRVLFLLQFEDIKTVNLIKLFDPIISARNIAIFASK